jgi:hypothetical protein
MPNAVQKSLTFRPICAINRAGFIPDFGIAKSTRLYARLIDRRRGFAARSKKALKKRLKSALRESPPPSLREVYARLSITQTISHGNFPEIHRAISARHREFQRRAKSTNRIGPRSPGV